MPRTGRMVALVLAGVLLAGCVPQGLAFRTDTRLTFVAPEDRATVRLPLTIDWEMRDFQVAGPGGEAGPDRGYFAVFVDSSPMPPGKDLRWLARKDSACRRTAGCPDAAYLAGRGIYPTTKTELFLEQLPRSSDDDRRERHRVTIVLLDPSSKRIGESAFELAFDVVREDL